MVKVVYGKSDAIVGLAAVVFKSDPAGYLGPPFIGATLDFLFIGILCCQVNPYYSTFPKDKFWIKGLVSSVLVLSVAKTAISFIVVWDKNILGFGDWRVAAAVPWSMYLGLPACTLISTTAQTFFVWRAFTLTGRNWYLLAVLISLMLTVTALSICSSIYLAIDPYYVPLLISVEVPMLVCSFVVDTIITLIVSYKLVKSRRGFNHRTDRALSQILAVTWECAAPPAVSQMINMIMTTTHGATAWPAIFNMLTPRLYAFSLLYSLNARTAINVDISQGTTYWSEGTMQNRTTHKSSNGVGLSVLSQHGRKDQAALGITNTLPVHVQTDTIMHTSPTDARGSGREKVTFSELDQTLDMRNVHFSTPFLGLQH